MKRLLFYLRLCGGYLRIGFLMLTQYPADTIIWIISMLLREAAGFLGVMTIAHVSGGLGSWNVYEICLLFSMCAIIEAIGQAFFDSVWGMSSNIRKGMLDVMLVRPASPFVQTLGQRMHFQAVVSMVVYWGILLWSMSRLHMGFQIGRILFLAEFLICGTIINSGIYTIFNSLNFWIVQGTDISAMVQTCREFAKYPLNIFPVMIQSFFTFLIPFGFVGYYPAAYLTGKAGGEVLLMLPVCAAIVAGIGAVIWRRGLDGYNSTGT